MGDTLGDKTIEKRCKFLIILYLQRFFSGKTGIRTLGPGKLVNGFRDRPDRPLRHLSVISKNLETK